MSAKRAKRSTFQKFVDEHPLPPRGLVGSEQTKKRAGALRKMLREMP